MKPSRTAFLFVAFFQLAAAAGSGAGAPPASMSYADLVRRLTDLEFPATLPDPGEKTAQWSSYDRASRLDEKSGKYIRWDANDDNNGILRKEDGRLVLGEMEGPGCIWRIWSAAPGQGHVRIYLDGADEPAVDLPFAGYFDGKNEPFTRPALVHTVAQGRNNYTPIPYRKSCRIVADEDWGAYYQFVYSTFPKGTEVPTFKRELAPEESAALDAANQRLTHCGPRDPGPGGTRSAGAALLRPNGGSAVARLEGPGAITLIRAQVDLPPAPGDRDPLREIVIQIRWDGERSSSVWAPLGDFFGTAPGTNAYRSLPCGLTADGWFYANWFMPFAEGAEIRFFNEGNAGRQLKYEIVQEELKGDAARYARFHAKWHRDEFLPTEIERQIDWPLLKTAGRGRFVGVMLHIWNPRGGWWGEGDEKFFVDDEKVPSTFGTGSEDYFGYAWCDPALFEHAFHSQTHNDNNNRGHVSVNRWQIADQIPFQKRFDGYLEKYFPNTRPTLYASTVFWYLAAGGHDPYSPVPVERRLGYYFQPPPNKVGGAIEAEALGVAGCTGGQVRPQDMAGFGDAWSDDTQLWWTGAKPGDTLALELSVTNGGDYRVFAQLTKAVDYGIAQFSLDGRRLGGPIDLYHNGVVATGELDLGVQALAAGAHRLTVEITGANPQAVKSHMFGLDYLRLVEAK